jgi:hypothetical protein
LEEGLARMQGLGDTLMIAMAQRGLGHLAFDRGDYEHARTAFAADLAASRALDDSGGVAGGLLNLAAVARVQGDQAGAVALYRACVVLWQAGGAHGNKARLLEGLAMAIARQPVASAARLEASAAVSSRGSPAACQPADPRASFDFLRVARLLGAAEAVRLASGKPMLPAERLGYKATVAAARAALGEAAFAAAWAAGQALTLEQAVAGALADDSDGRADAGVVHVERHATPSGGQRRRGASGVH